jgi:hypothetical protein
VTALLPEPPPGGNPGMESGSTAVHINNLADVAIAGTLDRQVLSYNGLTGEWNNTFIDGGFMPASPGVTVPPRIVAGEISLAQLREFGELPENGNVAYFNSDTKRIDYLDIDSGEYPPVSPVVGSLQLYEIGKLSLHRVAGITFDSNETELFVQSAGFWENFSFGHLVDGGLMI